MRLGNGVEINVLGLLAKASAAAVNVSLLPLQPLLAKAKVAAAIAFTSSRSRLVAPRHCAFSSGVSDLSTTMAEEASDDDDNVEVETGDEGFDDGGGSRWRIRASFISGMFPPPPL